MIGVCDVLLCNLLGVNLNLQVNANSEQNEKCAEVALSLMYQFEPEFLIWISVKHVECVFRSSLQIRYLVLLQYINWFLFFFFALFLTLDAPITFYFIL